MVSDVSLPGDEVVGCDSRWYHNGAPAGTRRGENALVSENLVVDRAFAVAWPIVHAGPEASR